MRDTVKSLEDSRRLNKGFTLIELLVVIAIIAILASIAIPQYMKYQRKSKVSSYAEPVARACLMDIVAYCIENPNSTPSTSSLANCSSSTVSTPGGNVSLTVAAAGTCGNDGSLSTNATVSATLAGVSDYKAVCVGTSDGIKCTVQ